MSAGPDGALQLLRSRQEGAVWRFRPIRLMRGVDSDAEVGCAGSG